MNHKNKQIKISEWLLEIILLVMIICFSLTAPNFLSIRNFLNILRSISFKGIIACMMTLVIISGEIDLSVGSIVAFSGVVTAYLNKLFSQKLGWNAITSIVLAILLAIILCACVGIIIGMLTTM